MKFLKNVVPSQSQLLELYKCVGWTSYTKDPEQLLQMVQNSQLVWAAFDSQNTTDDQLVGLIRVVGDGVTIAYIQDLLVLPTYQKNGIGQQLLTKTLTDLSKIRQLYISTDTSKSNQYVIDFYMKNGFQPMNEWGCITLARFLF
ncbi:MAG: GNAT family N-acetyltransferase [Rothia sp. (in: high G+C Gram-positive bacteria)]|nr:GNAT family N-acetyltransferase [Rothia sp. (in: high G+C Gram-positive bacteria)]